MRIQDLRPMDGKAIVEITKAGRDDEVLASGLIVYHSTEGKDWSPNLDWEIGKVVALGTGDWVPVGIGDSVFIQAPSGGVAGADIGGIFGEKKGRIVVIDAAEIVCKVEDFEE